jgi:hypothetical protein
MLQHEGVAKCLPHLREDMLHEAVEEYHSIRKDYQKLAEKLGVLAFRVGESCNNNICLMLSRSELGRLNKILVRDKRDNTKGISRWCEFFASGSFSDVFKFKSSAICQRIVL